MKSFGADMMRRGVAVLAGDERRPNITPNLKRFRIIDIIVLVSVLALGLAAMRDGSRISLLIAYCLAIGALFVATLAALVRAKPLGAWVGFAFFGWGWYLLTCLPLLNPENAQEPLHELLAAIVVQLHPAPAVPSEVASSSVGLSGAKPEDVAQYMRAVASENGEKLPPAVSSYLSKIDAGGEKQENALVIARMMLCILNGLIGSLIGRFLASRREPALPAP